MEIQFCVLKGGESDFRSLRRLILGGVDPLAFLFDQVDEAVEGLVGGDVVFDAVFADVEVDFVGGSADVAEVSVCHFSGSVDDTAHDGDGDAFEVVGLGSDGLGDALEVKEGASTAGTGDKFGFGDTGSGSLEEVVSKGFGFF